MLIVGIFSSIHLRIVCLKGFPGLASLPGKQVAVPHVDKSQRGEHINMPLLRWSLDMFLSRSFILVVFIKSIDPTLPGEGRAGEV